MSKKGGMGEGFLSSRGFLPQSVFSGNIRKAVINEGRNTAVTPLN